MFRRITGVCVLFIALFATTSIQAQRQDYLIRLLSTSDTFRVRAQAAISLGRVEANSAVVEALSRALSDSHPAVRTAAASSLERLADPAALPALRRLRRDRDRSVRRAVASAIRVLERVARQGSGSGTSGAEAQFYVGIGELGANQPRVDQAVLRRAQQFLQEQLREMEGVEVAPSNETNASAQRVIRRRRMTGYYIDGSIVSVGEQGGNMRATVSVILNTYPGRDMRAILQGSATVPGRTDRSAQEQAIQGALRGALRRLLQAMRASRR